MLALLLSFGLDYLGEPPSRLHPVVGLGRYLNWVKRQRERLESPSSLFILGFILLLLGCLGVALIAYALQWSFDFLPLWLNVTLTAVALKPSFSLFALIRAGRKVRLALGQSNLIKARSLLGYHLVSRATQDLSEAEVAGAAVESLAENLSDSVIAPLFHFAVFGLVGAWVYRFVNTADAMLGYRTGRLEFFGKPAARLDDLLNLIPARLTFLLLCLSATFVNADPAQTWRVALRDAGRTPSPNAGWPMAAVAGGLGIKLDKRNTYSLNESGDAPTADAIRSTERWLLAASLLGILGLGILGLGALSLGNRYA